ncbi:MAG: ABC transporter permease [Gemmatimonadota bacterium]
MDLWQDVRFSFRRLFAAPWFTLAAVAALALGIGANTAVFTFVNAVLFRGLPFEDADRMMAVSSRTAQGGEIGVSYLDYLDFRDQSRSFDFLSGHLNASVNLADDEAVPERIQGAYVTGNFFRQLGASPVLGRDFRDDDDLPGAEPVVMLGHSVWENRYGRDPGVLGLSVRVNSLLATVVGVMPPGMRFPDNTDLWIPQSNLSAASETDNRGVRSFNVLGTLAAGVSMEQARDELAALGRGLAETYPDTNRDILPAITSFDEEVNGAEIRIVFLSLLGAVAFVLLIACANVAGLLLARSTERTREIAVRVSMGATRYRIVRQLLVESLLLALAAGALGLGLSVVGIRWFDSVTQNVGKPYWMEFTMDPVVFGYMAAVCIATALLFGLAPALHVSKTDVNEVLKEGTRGGSGGVRVRRWSSALIVGELVMTVVLLSGAAFMIRSFMNMYRMDLGIDTAGLVTMETYLPLTQYPELAPRWDVYRDFLDRLAVAPELQSAALVSALPLGGGGGSGVEVDGRPVEEGVTRPFVTVLSASQNYFDVLGVAAARGRAFAEADGSLGSEVAIVNERFVELHFPEGDPLGRQIRVGYEGAPVAEAPWLTVVGVVPSIRQQAVQELEPDPVVYLPLRFNPARTVYFVARSRGELPAVTSLVRENMRLVNPDLPFFSVRTMDQVLVEERWEFRIFGTMFSVLAGMALVLSAVGLYSVTAHSVSQRIREFGIRISLGAEPGQISMLALRRVLVQLAIGLPLGLLGGFGAGLILRSLLVQTGPTDPLPLLAVVVVMGTVAVLACLWPARRAARLDPVAALRIE